MSWLLRAAACSSSCSSHSREISRSCALLFHRFRAARWSGLLSTPTPFTPSYYSTSCCGPGPGDPPDLLSGRAAAATAIPPPSLLPPHLCRVNFHGHPGMGEDGGDAVCLANAAATNQSVSNSDENSSAKDKAANVVQYSVLREGEADILLHGNDVFYNKAQIVNRDISIAVIRAFVAKRGEEQSTGGARMTNGLQHEEHGSNSKSKESSGEGPSGSTTPSVKPLRILEALAASGLRALRYAKEIEGVGNVVAADSDKVAFEACGRNIRLNGAVAAQKVEAKHVDSRVFMLTHEKEFDVVDLDPYGSPSVFLDSAVQTVADGGLLLCTATDMAVLCGNNGEVCYSKYGSYPLRGKFCHEMALRILLACIESHANRYKRYIVPLLSLSVDFYVRVFVRIYTSAKMIKATPSKLSYVYQCVGCDSYQFQPVGRISYKNNSARYMPANGPTLLPDCKECGKHFNMGGPMWAAPIHDPTWVSSILRNATAMKKRYPAFDKLHSILTAVSEELVDVPLYLSLHSMSATLKCTPPSATLFRSAVANAGYRISGSHANPLGVKTDAPMGVLWDIMRCWVKTHPVKPQPGETPGTVILSKEPKLEANFMKVNSALSKAQAEGVARFLPNPEDFWGPKPRAGRYRSAKQMPSAGPLVAGNVHVRDDDTKAVDAEVEAKRQKKQEQEGHESIVQNLDPSDFPGSSS